MLRAKEGERELYIERARERKREREEKEGVREGERQWARYPHKLSFLNSRKDGVFCEV